MMLIEPVNWQAARLPHFTHHENLLAAILLHGDAHLGLLQEAALDQAIAELVLERLHAETARLQPAEQRKRERAVGLHDVSAGQLRLFEDRDSEDVVRTDDVVLDGSDRRDCEKRQQQPKNVTTVPSTESPNTCCPQHDVLPGLEMQFRLRTHTSPTSRRAIAGIHVTGSARPRPADCGQRTLRS